MRNSEAIRPSLRCMKIWAAKYDGWRIKASPASPIMWGPYEGPCRLPSSNTVDLIRTCSNSNPTVHCSCRQQYRPTNILCLSYLQTSLHCSTSNATLTSPCTTLITTFLVKCRLTQVSHTSGLRSLTRAIFPAWPTRLLPEHSRRKATIHDLYLAVSRQSSAPASEACTIRPSIDLLRSIGNWLQTLESVHDTANTLLSLLTRLVDQFVYRSSGTKAVCVQWKTRVN